MSLLTNIAIGQYVPGHSIVHRLDPRTKFIISFTFILFIFMVNNQLTFAIAICFTLLAILLSNISIKYIWRGLKPVWLILLLTLFFHLWFTREGEIIFSLGWLPIYEEGLAQGVTITLRIFLIVLITSLLTLTTKPLVLTDGLEKLLRPLKKLGFPVHEFALMISISLRFIPTLLQETEKIMKAQASRGASFTQGNLASRFFHLLPILIPLFVSSFQRAEDLALAMEARGYRGGEGRTQIRQLLFGKHDYLALLLTFAVYAALLLLRTW